jgi:hypothetical protein
MIRGVVCSGSGQASEIDDAVHDARCKAAGVNLARGTLNVRVGDLMGNISILGEPTFATEETAPRGPLKWWPISISFPERTKHVFEAFVVRLKGSRATYLEIMSVTQFRAEEHVEDKDTAEIVSRRRD